MLCGLFNIVPHFSHFCEGFLLLLISMFKTVRRHSAEVLSSVPKQESCDVPYGKKIPLFDKVFPDIFERAVDYDEFNVKDPIMQYVHKKKKEVCSSVREAATVTSGVRDDAMAEGTAAAFADLLDEHL